MGVVYARASRVHAWLGEKDTSLSAQEHQDAQPSTSADWDYDNTYEGHVAQDSGLTDQICDNVYWTRSWIVQELVLARDIILYWEGSQLPWHKVIDLSSRTTKERAPIIRNIIMTRYASFEERNFESMFERFGQMQCLLPHDKIYSLFGIATDLQASGAILPDYELCVNQVFIQLCAWHAEIRPPQLDPLKLARLFLSNYPEHRRYCDCHAEDLVKIALRRRGVVADSFKQIGTIDDNGKTVVLEEDRVPRRDRVFQCLSRGTHKDDLAFALSPSHFSLIICNYKSTAHRLVYLLDASQSVSFEVLTSIPEDELAVQTLEGDTVLTLTLTISNLIRLVKSPVGVFQKYDY